MTFEEFEGLEYTGVTPINYNGHRKLMKPKYKVILDKMLEGRTFTKKELKEDYGLPYDIGKTMAYIEGKGYEIIKEWQIATIGSKRKYKYLKYRLHSRHLK